MDMNVASDYEDRNSPLSKLINLLNTSNPITKLDL